MGNRAFILAGNENGWLQYLEAKYFTPDFYILVTSFDLTSVNLLIRYGADVPLKWACSGAPNYICSQSSAGIYSTEAECKAVCKGPACNPVWTCELPRNGYESDGCGMRRANTRCDPIVSVPLFLTSDKISIQAGDIVKFSGKYKTGATVIIKADGIFGFEIIRATCNSAGDFSVPVSIKLSEGSHYFEAISDALILPEVSGKISITVLAKNTTTPPCVPNWKCETPLNGYETDGCGHRGYNSLCLPGGGTGDPGTTPCADGNTRVLPCPDEPSKSINQQCIGGKWTTVSDECGSNGSNEIIEGITNETLIIIGVVAIVTLFIILRRKK